MCLSNRLTSLSAALGGRTHLAVKLHTAAGRVTRVPEKEQCAGWAGTEETNDSAKPKSEFKSTLPVSSLLNSSHVVSSKQGGKSRVRMECTSEDMT